MAVISRILDHLAALMDQREVVTPDEVGHARQSLVDKLAEVESTLGLLVTKTRRARSDDFVDAATHLSQQLRVLQERARARPSFHGSPPIQLEEAEIVGVIEAEFRTREDVRGLFPDAAVEADERHAQLADVVAAALIKLHHPKELSDFQRATIITQCAKRFGFERPNRILSALGKKWQRDHGE